ncbi:MAG: hypothetical protein HY513_00190 [Candidatus Aenigmarchaeota archaeon]|nr:hypothetical protein [Candidatus Aenigmarchaeota archaeon]
MQKLLFGLILIVLIAGCTQNTDFNKALSGDVKQQPVQELIENQENQQNTAPQEIQTTVSDSDAVNAYPINCQPRLGFDNYRTEQSFAINPKNNMEMYVAIEYKGLYKSADGGKTWSFSGKGIKALPRSDDPTKPCHQLHFTMYIDPQNPQRILLPGGAAPSKVGMGVGGLAESLDSGKTWHQLFTSEMSAYTESVITDPRDSSTIYVTTTALPQGMSGPDQGKIFVKTGIVYKTTDGGKTWDELPTGFYESIRVTGLFLDSKNSDTLRIATFGLPPGTNIDKKATEEQWGFLESKDAGKTWTKLDSTTGLGIRHVDGSSANLDHFFMMASKDNTDKVYYSIDGSLKESNSPVNFARYDPNDKTGMRLIGLNLYVQPNDIYESDDAGITWNPVGKLPEGITNDHRASNIVFDPVEKDTIYINSDLARIWKSPDKGKTWEQLLSVDKL